MEIQFSIKYTKNILNEKLVQNTDFPFYFYLLQIFTDFDKSRYIALVEYFIRIIYDIKKYTYVTFFVHLYHRIRYLDIERLKAKKCHNLQMIHDSDSSEHGW